MTIYSDGQFVFEGIIDLAVGTTTQSVDSTYICYHRAIALGINFTKIINLQVTFCGDTDGIEGHNALKECGMQYNRNVEEPTKAIYIWAIIEKAKVKKIQDIRFSFLINGYC